MKKKKYHNLTTKAHRLNYRNVDHMLDDLLERYFGVVSDVAQHLECSAQAIYQHKKRREAEGR